MHKFGLFPVKAFSLDYAVSPGETADPCRTRKSDGSTLYGRADAGWTAARAGPVRSSARARFLRNRLRRQHQGAQVPRDSQPIADDPQQYEPPRRRRLRAQLRRRRGHPHCRSRTASSPRCAAESGIELKAAPGDYGVGMVFMPRNPATRAVVEGPHREDHLRGGPRLPRLARPTRRRLLPRQYLALGHAPYLPGLRRAATPELGDDMAFERKLYVVRKKAEKSTRGQDRGLGRLLLLREPLLQDDRLQGHVHLGAGPALLPRPLAPRLRVGPQRRALALQHEHLPELGARPPLPLPHPQRRDQHAARQRQLDARPRVDDQDRPLRPRRREHHARSSTRTAPTRRCSTTASSSST